MDKDRLAADIDERFDAEQRRVVDQTEEKAGKGKIVRVLLSIGLASVILGTMVYSLIIALK